MTYYFLKLNEQPDALLYILDFMKSHCRNLRTLQLPSHASTKAAYMASLPSSIRTLRIHYASCFKADTLESLSQAHLPYLRSLELVRGLVRDKDLAFLPQQITSLSLEGSFSVAGDGSALKSLPSSLLQLDLSWCHALKSTALADLPDSLTSLDLSHCARLTDAAFSSLPSSLTKLDMTECTDISSTAFETLPPSLKTLKINSFNGGSLPPCLSTLHLAGCHSNDPLAALPAALTTLSLSSMGITDAGLSFLPLSLQYLSIVDCPKLTSEGTLGKKYNS